ncbi:class I SAM-dependent methyltransferase [Sulfurimonas paralvinellae]|nr:class I SAM-dependent methyltransferase [Sulfurimonas paralvinellae]
MDKIFKEHIEVKDNFISLKSSSNCENQQQTNEAFSEKWMEYENSNEKEKFYKMQQKWYLELYGFENEDALAKFLSTKKYIFDAGCGLGYKAKWFAELAPDSIVIGMDFSEACSIAANNYKHIKNLFFIKGDIADLPFQDNSIDYVSCDQVIMHTEVPEETFKELTRITKNGGGEFVCYVYAKKALPRELLDDYFRVETKNLTNEQLWEMSRQLTELGKRLSQLKIEIDIPDIPLLGIKGGKQDIQRFIYWNFLKCYWNGEQGEDNSDMINFDWYSPSNARRYSEDEFKKMISTNGLKIEFFHIEEACYSGRFSK